MSWNNVFARLVDAGDKTHRSTRQYRRHDPQPLNSIWPSSGTDVILRALRSNRRSYLSAAGILSRTDRSSSTAGEIRVYLAGTQKASVCFRNSRLRREVGQ